jgi:DNA-3-methyladenine glycosylase I
MNEKFRCFGNTPLYIDYHDNEWGRPVHDDNKLFEMLILEGAQARLSWITVLKKREAYREAFDGFDPAKVALYPWPKGTTVNPASRRFWDSRFASQQSKAML